MNTTQKTAFFFASLLVSALQGKHGEKAAAYYGRAVSYHTKQKTNFPRVGDIWKASQAVYATLTQAIALQVMDKASQGILASRDATGNAVFDRMMIELPKFKAEQTAAAAAAAKAAAAAASKKAAAAAKAAATRKAAAAAKAQIKASA